MPDLRRALSGARRRRRLRANVVAPAPRAGARMRGTRAARRGAARTHRARWIGRARGRLERGGRRTSLDHRRRAAARARLRGRDSRAAGSSPSRSSTTCSRSRKGARAALHSTSRTPPDRCSPAPHSRSRRGGGCSRPPPRPFRDSLRELARDERNWVAAGARRTVSAPVPIALAPLTHARSRARARLLGRIRRRRSARETSGPPCAA